MGEELELRWSFSNNDASISSFAPKLFDEISFESKNDDQENKETLTEKNKINDNNAHETFDSFPYGFFVENCLAERLDGMEPAPAPLPLIMNG